MDKSKKDIPTLLEINLKHLPDEQSLQECLFDWSAPDETPDVLLYQEDGKKVMFTRENLSLIAGAEKSGKTFLTSILATACLGKPVMGFLTDMRDLKISVFDTEQGYGYIRQTIARTFNMLGWEHTNNDRYKHYNLIYLSHEQRLATIQYYIEEHKPDVVFIDGIVDLVEDFNNNIQASNVVTLLNAIAAKNNCHVCGVLHTNKVDRNARGHIGSIYQQKCETVMMIEYKKEGFPNHMVVSAGPCRNEAFETFRFRIQGKGADAIPVFMESPTVIEDPKVTKYKCLNDIFYKNKNNPIPAMELNSHLRTVLNRGSRTASSLIADAKKDGILIEKQHKHSNRTLYSLARFETSINNEEGDVFDDNK